MKEIYFKELAQDEFQESTKFPTINEIYKYSTVNISDLYDALSLVSYKSSNSIVELLGKPYFMVSEILKRINKFIDAENGNKDGENGNSTQDQFSEMQSKQMNNMKSMQNGFKNNFSVPKFKT